jgi:hypothetical protein
LFPEQTFCYFANCPKSFGKTKQMKNKQK